MVHYPLLSDLHNDGAGVIHFQRHITRIFPLVGMLMAAELMVAAWRCWSEGSMTTMVSLGLVLLIWAVTGLFAAANNPVTAQISKTKPRDTMVVMDPSDQQRQAATISSAAISIPTSGKMRVMCR